MKNRIVINGVVIEVDGSNVSVCDGVIYVNGIPVQSQLAGNVHIYWHGDLASLDADGSVECENIHGNITAGGSVRCGDISGNVTAGGSVKVSSYGSGIATATASASRYGSSSAAASTSARTPKYGSNHIMAGGSVHIS